MSWYASLYASFFATIFSRCVARINSLVNGLKVEARCFFRVTYECFRRSRSDKAIDSHLSEFDILIFEAIINPPAARSGIHLRYVPLIIERCLWFMRGWQAGD